MKHIILFALVLLALGKVDQATSRLTQPLATEPSDLRGPALQASLDGASSASVDQSSTPTPTPTRTPSTTRTPSRTPSVTPTISVTPSVTPTSSPPALLRSTLILTAIDVSAYSTASSVVKSNLEDVIRRDIARLVSGVEVGDIQIIHILPRSSSSSLAVTFEIRTFVHDSLTTLKDAPSSAWTDALEATTLFSCDSCGTSQACTPSCPDDDDSSPFPIVVVLIPICIILIPYTIFVAITPFPRPPPQAPYPQPPHPSQHPGQPANTNLPRESNPCPQQPHPPYSHNPTTV